MTFKRCPKWNLDVDIEFSCGYLCSSYKEVEWQGITLYKCCWEEDKQEEKND